ncbi:MAG: sulfur carrier protein ThiS adenylyltransferase ThiF [Candidatus Krumholzibacteria bacterium]|nr:sulfur carrier protein ThiS adenylyltransferase ThiF [Candidatus Krumholzibacteria bacterium]
MATTDPIFERNVPGATEKLRAAPVGIAGCGGLGSNAAMLLARAGVGRLILADHDVVELSNLNRQHFFRKDVGRTKVRALADHLRAVNPAMELALHPEELEPDAVAAVFAGADLLIEAFDLADRKRWLIEAWCRAFPDRPIVAASGLSGVGRTAAMRVRSSGKIHVVGDEESDMSEGLCAPRVALAAAMQANIAVELLLGMKEKR